MSQTPRRIAMFGATAGCSYEALKLLVTRPDSAKPTVDVYVFCRNVDKIQKALEADGVTKLDTESTKVRLIKGDAFDVGSVESFFKQALQDGPLTDVTFSIGGTPGPINKFKPFAPVQFLPGQENICQRSSKNVVEAMQTVVAPAQPDHLAPNLVVITSNGIGHSSHEALPYVLKKTVYSAFLHVPHEDKAKMERFLHEQYAIPSPDFNAQNDESKRHPALAADRLTIVRPSLLLDGKAKGVARASDSILSGAWSISRKDVGAFLAGDCLHILPPITKETVKGGNAYVVSY